MHLAPGFFKEARLEGVGISWHTKGMENPSPSRLFPVHQELTLGQRLLFQGVPSDVLAQAIGQGLMDNTDLNLVVDDSPLIEHWLESRDYEIPLTELAVMMGVELRLEWPVATDPSQIEMPLKNGWDGTPAWGEWAIIRLIEKGLDPLARWKNSPGNLLEWATERDHPWVLKACLEALSPEQRKEEVERKLVKELEYGNEELTVQANRLHFAMGHETPLVAQVWHGYGAPLEEATRHGETPIFFASSVSTLQWALSQGADPTVVNADGNLPVEIWRHHTRDAEQWQAMQAYMGNSVDQSLGLIRAAVAQSDLEALKKAFELINDPAITFRDGKTVLEHVAEQALLANDGRGRTQYRRMELSKMLAFLWPRTDLTVAKASPRSHGLNGLQVAWLGSMLSSKGAVRAANLSTPKADFQTPDWAPVARWSRAFFEPETDREIATCEKAVRFWVLDQCCEEWQARNPDVDKVLDAVESLLKNVELSSVSLNESIKLARVLAFPVVKIRDTNQLTGEQTERVMGLVLRGMAVQAKADQHPSNSSWEPLDYQTSFQELMPHLGVHENGIEHLAAMAVGLAGMGVRPSREEVADMLDDLLSSSYVVYHPAVSPILPAIRQEVLSHLWDDDQLLASKSSKPRF